MENCHFEDMSPQRNVKINHVKKDHLGCGLLSQVLSRCGTLLSQTTNSQMPHSARLTPNRLATMVGLFWPTSPHDAIENVVGYWGVSRRLSVILGDGAPTCDRCRLPAADWVLEEAGKKPGAKSSLLNGWVPKEQR